MHCLPLAHWKSSGGHVKSETAGNTADSCAIQHAMPLTHVQHMRPHRARQGMVYVYQAQAVTCSRNSHGKNWYVIDSWSSVSVTRTLTAVFLINAVETVNDAITCEVIVQTHRAVDGDAFEVFVVTLGAARAVTRQSTRLTDAAHNTRSKSRSCWCATQISTFDDSN